MIRPLYRLFHCSRRRAALGLVVTLAVLAPLSALRAEGEVFVLCYHTFQGRSSDYDVSPEEFERQIRLIRDLGYSFVSMQDALAGRVTGDRNVLISIDDGNKSVAAIYERVLVRNGIKPTLFIYPAILDRVDYAMTTQQLKRYHENGAFVGSHGYYHLFLNQKTRDRSVQAFRDEVYKSRDVLQQKLGAPIRVFAYPFGVHTELGETELKRAGYEYAFTINHGRTLIPLSRNRNPLKLPRYLISKAGWNLVYSILRNHARRPENAAEKAAEVREGASRTSARESAPRPAPPSPRRETRRNTNAGRPARAPAQTPATVRSADDIDLRR